MGYNLTNERIQDTFEQLVQVSGSKLLDGTGSLLTPDIAVVSSSYSNTSSYSEFAVTASYALNAGGGTDIDTGSLVTTSSFNAYTSSNDSAVAGKLETSTFNTYTSSNDAEIASINDQIALIEAGSGSADWDLLTNKPSGIVSSSAQSVANVSGQSLNGETIAPLVVSASLVQGYGFSTLSGFGIINDIGIITGSIGRIGTSGGYIQWRSTNTNGFYLQAPNDSTLLAVQDNSVSVQNGAFTASNALFSGDLVVNGTASFGYLQSVTGSATIIGDAFVVVNSDTPTQRYAGIKVYDSGSPFTSSFYFDGQTNDWNYEYSGSDDTNFGVALFGPEYGTKGSPSYPSNNVIQKGNGGHHLVDSIMTDDGSTVLVSGSVSASAFLGDGSGLTGVGGATQEGSGASSLESTVGTSGEANGNFSISLGNQTAAQGTDSIAIGASAQVTAIGAGGQSAISIGKSSVASDPYTIAIGENANSGHEDSIAIGRDSATSNTYGVAIGYDSTAGAQATAVGAYSNASTLGTALGRGANASSTYGIAIGFQSNGANTAVAIGKSVNADEDAIGIGDSVVATGLRAVAIGYQVSATATDEINIGDMFTYNSASNAEISLKSNVETTGQIYSPTFAGSVASSTSSIDFDNGNFATLSLTADTYLANPSNLKSGTTYTIIIDSGSLISNHGTAWKFAGGTAPTYTDGTDVLTCVSDGTNLYATALTDFQ